MEAMKRAEPLHGGADGLLHSRIKLRIYNLDPELERAFLDIVVFLVGHPWERAERLVGKLHLERLQSYGLVRRGEWDSNSLHLVEVDDVIRAVGLQIAEADEEEVRINCPANSRTVVEMNGQEVHIHGVAKFSAGSCYKVVGLGNVEIREASILKQLGCLRIMMDVDIKGECPTPARLEQLAVVYHQRSDSRTPYDLRGCLSLKELIWQCDVELDLNLEDLLGAMDLQVLEIVGGGRLQNFDIIQCFRRLRVLRLPMFTGVEMLPDGIARLTELTELDLSGCRSLWFLPQEMENLTGLRKLDLSGCSRLESLPQGLFRLMGLKELDVSNCESLRYLPEHIACLTGLERLSFMRCRGLQMLPNGVASMLTALERLNLQEFESLRALPEDISLLTGLKELDLRRCRSLEHLPEGISSLKSLELMHLYGCVNLEALPEGISCLTCLRRLNLSECERLRSLPEGVASLTGLKKLDLHTCQMLSSLPDGISSLTGLEVIDLCGCTSLMSLPEGISTLPRLGRLSMGGCVNLRLLPKDISNLTCLRRLELWGCRGLHHAPEQIKSLLGSLKVVDLRGCEGCHWLNHGRCSWLEGLTVVDLPVDEWDDTYEVSVSMILRSTGSTFVLMDLSLLPSPLPDGVSIMSSTDLLESFEVNNLDC